MIYLVFLIVFAALPVVLKGIDVAGRRPCRWCRSAVRREAQVCPYCGRWP